MSFICLKKPLIFAFYFKTSLIIKELIKHENKFNRKVFHDRENLQNFHISWKDSKSISWTFLGSLRSELSWNTHFMKCSERNISRCILAFINFPIFTKKYLCWSHFLIQLETGRPATFIKKRPQHKCFHVNITKFLRIAVLYNTPGNCLWIWSKNF